MVWERFWLLALMSTVVLGTLWLLTPSPSPPRRPMLEEATQSQQLLQVSNAVTIVTGFWNPDHMPVRKRTNKEYKEWIHNMLANLQTPMVIYCDKEFAPLAHAQTRHSKQVSVVVRPITSFYVWMKYGPNITLLNAMNREKNIYSPEYSMVMHEKMAMVRQTQLENPFSSSIFLWVDIGIDRRGFFASHPTWPTNLMPFVGDRFLMNNVDGNVNPSSCPSGATWPEEYIHKIAQAFGPPSISIGGGIWGGTAKAIERVESVYYFMLEAFIRQNTSTQDQSILAAVACTDYDSFFGHEPFVQAVIPRGGTTLWHHIQHLMLGNPDVWFFLLDYLK